MTKKMNLLAVLLLACGAAANAAEGAAGLLYKEAGAIEAAIPAAGAAANAEKSVKYDAGVTEGAWKRANLRATDGTAITVDYVPITAPNYTMANPVWVNLWLNDGGSHRIRVILTNFLVTSGGPAVVKETQQVWLSPAGNGRYTGQFQRIMLSEGIYTYGGNLYRQELVVEKDGVLLKDPINGTNSFKFQMSNSRGAEKSVSRSSNETVYKSDSGCTATVEERANGLLVHIADGRGQQATLGFLKDYTGGDIAGFCSPAELQSYGKSMTLSCNGQGDGGSHKTRGYAVLGLEDGISSVEVRGDVKRLTGWKTDTQISCSGLKPVK